MARKRSSHGMENGDGGKVHGGKIAERGRKGGAERICAGVRGWGRFSRNGEAGCAAPSGEETMNRKLSLASMAFGIGVVLLGSVLRERLAPRPLRMGTHAEFAPFESREGGAIVGFDVDLGRAIAEKAGRPLEIVDMPFEDLIPALEAGELDMALVAMTITEERAKRVDFSRPYYRATQVAMMREGEEEPATKEELAGRKIGVQAGTTSEALAREIAGEENVKRAPTAKAALADLLNSQVDFVLVDEQPAEAYRKVFPEARVMRFAFPEELYGVAVGKGNAALLGTINETLDAIAADGRLDWFVDRWMVQAE